MTIRQIGAGTHSLLVIAALGAGTAGVAALSELSETASPEVVVQTEPEPPLASLAIPQEDFGVAAPTQTIQTKLKRRENLSDLADRVGLPRADAAQALYALTASGHLDARRLLPGLEVTAHIDNDALVALAIAVEPGRNLLATRLEDGRYHSTELKARLTAKPMIVKGEISSSLYEDARVLGAGDQQIVDFAQVFAYDIDFQREVHPGDKFEIVFDILADERGQVIRRGDVLYVALHGRAADKAFYRFTTPDENITDYFQANGESATKFLMKTPINGARLSSHFGKRRHPISGYTRLHKGTDFAAPTGTPIYAAGHGVVERASRYGGYGHYVRIRHANGYKTAYAHMSRYGRGIRSGVRVRQGQVIGYVGSTGASTGPHLHYEIYKNGKAVDAMRLKLPTGRKLAMDPDVLAVFEVERDRINAIRGDISLPETVVAEAKPDTATN